MARSYTTGSRGADKVRASAGPTNPSIGSAPEIEPFIEGGLGLSPAELKTFAGNEIFDSASDTTVEFGGKTYEADFDIRFAMTDVEDGEEGEKEPTLIKTAVTELRDSTGKVVPDNIRAQLMNQTDFRTALDEEINATFQKSTVEAGNYNLAKKVGKLASEGDFAGARERGLRRSGGGFRDAEGNTYSEGRASGMLTREEMAEALRLAGEKPPKNR